MPSRLDENIFALPGAGAGPALYSRATAPCDSSRRLYVDGIMWN
jgi:hypothetical protein